MEQSVEKSCWGITFWAVATVIAVVLVASFISNPDQVVAADADANAPAKAISVVSE